MESIIRYGLHTLLLYVLLMEIICIVLKIPSVDMGQPGVYKLCFQLNKKKQEYK